MFLSCLLLLLVYLVHIHTELYYIGSVSDRHPPPQPPVSELQKKVFLQKMFPRLVKIELSNHYFEFLPLRPTIRLWVKKCLVFEAKLKIENQCPFKLFVVTLDLKISMQTFKKLIFNLSRGEKNRNLLKNWLFYALFEF